MPRKKPLLSIIETIGERFVCDVYLDTLYITVQVSREYYSGILHGIKVVTFFKDVSYNSKPTVLPEQTEKN